MTWHSWTIAHIALNNQQVSQIYLVIESALLTNGRGRDVWYYLTECLYNESWCALKENNLATEDKEIMSLTQVIVGFVKSAV